LAALAGGMRLWKERQLDVKNQDGVVDCTKILKNCGTILEMSSTDYRLKRSTPIFNHQEKHIKNINSTIFTCSAEPPCIAIPRGSKMIPFAQIASNKNLS
jgi:hypothetical protein